MIESPHPTHDSESHPQSRAPIASGILLTVIAWFLSRIVVGAAWGPARNPLTYLPSLWKRRDSFHYLAIAVQGRTFGRCGTPGFPANAITRFAHLQLCGTAGWLPGYPELIKAVHVTGLARPDAALLVSWSAIAIAMFLIWIGWGRDLTPGRALLLLVLFGIFPGCVYNFALYPTSVALAFVVGSVLAATRERFFIAALLMAVAGICYPSAWFAAGGLALGLVIFALPLGPRVIMRRAIWGLAGLSSLLVLWLHDQIAFDHFDAYFLIQNQPNVQPPQAFPGQGFLILVIKENTVVQKLMGRFSAAVLAIQSIVALALSGAAAVLATKGARREKLDPAQLYPALVGITMTVVLVLVSNAGAWTRSVVLAAPCVVCLRRIPLPILCGIIGVVGVTTALISRPFFVGS